MNVSGVDVAGTVAVMVKASLTAHDVAWLNSVRGGYALMVAGNVPAEPGAAHVLAAIDALLAP